MSLTDCHFSRNSTKRVGQVQNEHHHSSHGPDRADKKMLICILNNNHSLTKIPSNIWNE